MDSAPPAYFSIRKRLYNGNAVLFIADAEGETIDFNLALAEHFISGCKDLKWLETIKDVEATIEEGEVLRPQTVINGTVFWEWNKEGKH